MMKKDVNKLFEVGKEVTPWSYISVREYIDKIKILMWASQLLE